MDVSKLTIETDSHSDRKILNKRFKILKKIGQGQFGKVLLALDIDDTNGTGNKPAYVAIKTINRLDKTKLITKDYLSHTTKIKREIQIMKECHHPNVVKLYKVIDDLKYDKILLVLEYCELGEIDWKRYNHYHEKYDKKNGLTLNKILRDVANGLEYLHEYKKIVHRDLKPSNLLISEDHCIKISDFGVSLILENNVKDDQEMGKHVGTPAFFAPELCQFVNNRLSMIQDNLQSTKKIDSRIDLWSLGVTLYCLMFNDLPFKGFNEFDLFKNIVDKDVVYTVENIGAAQHRDNREIDALIDLVSKLLCKDPNQRISMKDIKNHPFTLYGISREEQRTFLHSNDGYLAPPQGVASRIKRLFSPKLGAPRQAPVPEAPVDAPSQLAVHHDELEHVDDLLDSYLDDSSSWDSDNSASPVLDTTNVLGDLDPSPDGASTSSRTSSLDPAGPRLLPSPRFLSSNQFASVRRHGADDFLGVPEAPDFAAPDSGVHDQRVPSGDSPSHSPDASGAPVALGRTEGATVAGATATTAATDAPHNSSANARPVAHYGRSLASEPPCSSASQATTVPTVTSAATAPRQGPRRKPSLTIAVRSDDPPLRQSSSSPAEAFKPPVIASFFTSSPKSASRVYSPSRRAFASPHRPFSDPHSPARRPSSVSSSAAARAPAPPSPFADLFEPPPMFGAPAASPVSSSSRKNSFVSLKSNPLSRLTSSSSSLNLNAYLSDAPDPAAGPARDHPREPTESTEPTADDTLVLTSDAPRSRPYNSMARYLDSL
ncbi:Piso0_001459 [Millerozyma farinosa CBS 7064]|uniref:Piso0_001459 protein n=1 Tax=Pichia sorbitophila (strain ATCC MYA-4447 / BCRC 22081 / CBS 7064 / NBRC 10061 / NRRL Y-12695) TaxID=559304 RepID=G8YN81_PICSO|nr:Piso0_001459 [Millerozyma farinosa CBS 7064]